MEKKLQSLEKELNESPDWKQWLPVWGLKEVSKANLNGLPAINDDAENHPVRYYGGMIYQISSSLGVITGVAYGLAYLMEKLI